MITHRRINNILSFLVIALGLYLVLAPFLPSIAYWWQKRGGFDAPSYVTASENGGSDKQPPDDKPGNRLAIPSIGLEEQIFEGQSENTANKGVWRRPKTAKPGGGNTVLAGHRFSYSPAVHDPFYHLDKVKNGDLIVILWEGKPTRYRVNEIKVVNPEDVYIEDATDTERLTIYTCTPLWTSKQRLVLIAEPEVKSE